MSDWKKEFSKKVDQTDHVLPPTWKSTGKGHKQRKQAEQVFQSEPSRKVVKKLIAWIDMACEKVILCSFLFADDELQEALLRAAKRGIRVYMMLASESRLEREPRKSDNFGQKVFTEHKEMLDQLAGYALIRSADSFHAKVVLVDPDLPGKSGLLLTSNLTKEALSRNEELAVQLKPKEILKIYEKLKWAFWECAEHQAIQPGRLSSFEPVGLIEQPVDVEGVLWTAKDRTQLKEKALELIENEEVEIIASSFGWGAEHEIVRALCEKARGGVDVTILARLRPAAMPGLLALAEAGARVLGFRWLHAKSVWTAYSGALITSANFERHGMDEGFELGVSLVDERSGELGKLLRSWIGSAYWELMPEPFLGELEGDVRIWHEGQLLKESIEKERIVDLGKVVASDISDMTVAMPELPSPKNGIAILAHYLECFWCSVPPQVHPKAKEAYKKMKGTSGKKAKKVSYKPPVFKEPGGRRVVVVNGPEQLSEARAILRDAQAQAIVASRGK